MLNTTELYTSINAYVKGGGGGGQKERIDLEKKDEALWGPACTVKYIQSNHLPLKRLFYTLV